MDSNVTFCRKQVCEGRDIETGDVKPILCGMFEGHEPPCWVYSYSPEHGKVRLITNSGADAA